MLALLRQSSLPTGEENLRLNITNFIKGTPQEWTLLLEGKKVGTVKNSVEDEVIGFAFGTTTFFFKDKVWLLYNLDNLKINNKAEFPR